MRALVFDSVILGYVFSLVWGLLFLRGSEKYLLGRNTLIVVALILLAAGISALIQRLRIETVGTLLFKKQAVQKKATRSWVMTYWGLQLSITFLLSCYVGGILTTFSFYDLLDAEGLEGAGRIFKGLVTPEFSILPRAVVAIIETIFIAFMATVIALPVAFVMSFVCAKNIMGRTFFGYGVYLVLRTFFNIIRSIEPLVWAVIFGVWVGIGPFAGMLALMLHSVASLVKQYSEIIEGVEDGPIEAIVATGAKPLQVVWFGVVPQIVLPFVSFTIYRWDINVRMATVIGLVGGGGIGDMLIQYQGQALWREVGCLVMVIALVVWAMDTASVSIREAIK